MTKTSHIQDEFVPAMAFGLAGALAIAGLAFVASAKPDCQAAHASAVTIPVKGMAVQVHITPQAGCPKLD